MSLIVNISAWAKKGDGQKFRLTRSDTVLLLTEIYVLISVSIRWLFDLFILDTVNICLGK